jgi:transcriptional regulator with XRE-family HTH domain
MAPQQERAERVRAELEARGLTQHAAHLRLDISREAMARLWHGRDVGVETVERFARGLGLDVNDWREAWGYARVEPGDPAGAAATLLRAVERHREALSYEPDLEQVDVRGFQGTQNLPAEDLEILNESMRALIAAKRRERGLG